ncbi:methyl-accepting chemotaxis protein [Saccharibacillus sp. CPCC 101409]|uniref:methyl-accepting chemotaxis protein n=1 Tax=Saccharibacillus sp. CPCC 101409 TaxID=3058041 RepID=UPI002671EF6A|nr:methyl-accepting chemotaxis protein [Saccharibacillus sp. CPCC 101409]MDO3411687.1 methyl-accepting chemotaxis protein [Saccharibacillus sp. CPCC 101409]
MNILDALTQSIPYLRKLINAEAMIALTDTRQFVFYSPAANLDFGLTPGKPIPSNDPNLQQALRGESSAARIPASVYGTEVDGQGLPVFDEEGQLVGAIMVAYTPQTENFLQGFRQRIEEVSRSLTDYVSSIAAQSQQLAAATTEIKENSGRAVTDAREVNKVTSFIREISEQTNMLGLNAAIEAARVGEQGAGFQIVASEVRKLSVDTKKATQNIELALNNVQSSILRMEQEITSISDASNEQAQLLGEFSSLTDRLNELSREFSDFTRQVLGEGAK